MEELIGVKMHLMLDTGEQLDGWHYSRTMHGYYIALDPEGKNIQFVRKGQWGTATYDHAGEKAQFRPANLPEIFAAYRALRDDLRVPMNQGLDRLDQNHLRSLTMRINKTRQDLKRIQAQSDQAPLYLVLDARESYEELLYELTLSGINDILLKKRNEIRGLIFESTIPMIDAQYVDADELDEMMQRAKERDNLFDTDLGGKPLQRLSPEVLSSAEGVQRESHEPSDVNQDNRARQGLLKIAAWLKITAGCGLAAANLAFGALAGVVSALPTLGIGTVATVVGIATSTYTGLNTASDVLKDMATNLEDDLTVEKSRA